MVPGAVHERPIEAARGGIIGESARGVPAARIAAPHRFDAPRPQFGRKPARSGAPWGLGTIMPVRPRGPASAPRSKAAMFKFLAKAGVVAAAALAAFPVAAQVQ